MSIVFRFGRELAKSRSSHFLKSDDVDNASTPAHASQANAATDDENLSSWARYLKNKYGGRKRNSDSDATTNGTNTNENSFNNNNNRDQYNKTLVLTDCTIWL